MSVRASIAKRSRPASSPVLSTAPHHTTSSPADSLAFAVAHASLVPRTVVSHAVAQAELRDRDASARPCGV